MSVDLQELELPDLTVPYETIEEALKDIQTRLSNAYQAANNPKQLSPGDTISQSKARAHIYSNFDASIKNEAETRTMIPKQGLHGFIEFIVRLHVSALSTYDEEDLKDRVANLQQITDRLHAQTVKLIKAFQAVKKPTPQQKSVRQLYLASGGSMKIKPKVIIDREEAIKGFESGTHQVAYFLRACMMKTIKKDPFARTSQETKAGLRALSKSLLNHLDHVSKEIDQLIREEDQTPEDDDHPTP